MRGQNEQACMLLQVQNKILVESLTGNNLKMKSCNFEAFYKSHHNLPM